MPGLRDARRDDRRSSGAIYYLVAQRGARTTSTSRTSSPARPSSASDISGGGARRGERSPRRSLSASGQRDDDDDPSRRAPRRAGAAMQRVPELAGRDLTLTALSGGITNRNFLVDGRRHGRPLRHPAGRQRHPPARHQPRGRARGDGRGRRASASGQRSSAFIRPEGYLVTRFIEGSPRRDEAVREPDDARPRRRLAPADPRRPGDPRACSSRSGSSRPTARSPWRGRARSRRSTSWPHAIGRRIELACLADADRAAAVPQRPAQRELHRRRRAHPDRRLGVRRDGRSRSSTWATSASTTS